MTNRTAAIVYDFDGTLAEGNIQEHSFIPRLGIEKCEFWKGVKEQAEEHDADEILVYMWRMLEVARAKNVAVTRTAMIEHGRATPLFAGVESWFNRINAYARSQQLDLEHYIISSGIEEMIQGCTIYGQFKRVFASRFIYDENDEAVWPGVAVNYTTKTQFLFRINKGIDTTYDNEAINRWVPMDERPVPFERMIFVGDGETDIPAMKMVRHQGGHSVAVFDPKKWERLELQKRVHSLIAEDRVHFVAPADYSENSQLDVTIKGSLGRFGNRLRHPGSARLGKVA
ncbi:MAG TPA: HAD family hydrolase [Kofleriaceae bacterium]|jgi:phosphoserine phosphatase